MRPGRPSFPARLAFLAPVLCAACLAADAGRDESPAPEVPDGVVADPGGGDLRLDEEATSPADPGEIGPADVVPGDVSPGDLRCADGFIFIDFPCDRPFACDDERTFRRLTSYGCAEAGYDPECCSGGACARSDPMECPEETYCVEEGWSYRGDSPCRDIDCGRDGDPACPDEQYCETPRGQCGTPGVCVRADCTEGIRYQDAWQVDRWQCGCDGVPYPDSCHRQAAAVALASDGPCCDPARLAIPPDNPDHFTKWVACIRPDVTWDELPPAVADVLRWARSYALAEPLGCLPGETGYTKDLDIHVGDKPEPEVWTGLCQLASMPFVRTVFGIAGFACEGVPCWEGLSCRSAPYCPSPCGCCTCADGDRACGNDVMGQNHHHGIVTCQGGCWSDPEWCAGPGTECVESAGGPECGYTCDAIREWYANLGTWGNCTGDDSCVVVPGGCETGLGPCWIPFAPNEFVDAARAAELLGRWEALGCGVPMPCTCGVAPKPRCESWQCRLEGS